MIREACVIVKCTGHPLVRANHPSTFEITRDAGLTTRGDCIIGIGADCGAAGLPAEFRSLLSDDDARLTTLLSCEGMSVEIRARGSSGLSLSHPTDMVWRRSGYTCGRTVAVHADTTAQTLPRSFVKALQRGGTLTATLTVTVDR